MGLFETGGSFPAGLTPSPTKTLFFRKLPDF